MSRPSETPARVGPAPVVVAAPILAASSMPASLVRASKVPASVDFQQPRPPLRDPTPTSRAKDAR